MYDDRVIKLPIKNYLFSLKNFMLSKDNSNFNSSLFMVAGQANTKKGCAYYA